MFKGPETPTDPNMALLHFGTTRGIDEVKEALKNGADIDYYDPSAKSYDFTGAAIKKAMSLGFLELIKYLLKQGANPYLPYNEDPDKKSGYESHFQIAQKTQQYINSIMKNPRTLNRIDKNGYTPLGFCIKNKYEDKAEELIDFGANVCKIDKHGKRPLVYAAEVNSGKIAKKLLEKGAEVSIFSALESALECCSDEVVNILIEAKPEMVNLKLTDGSTPLFKALSRRNAKITKILIENGADVSVKNDNGNSPLAKALEVHSIDSAEILLPKIENGRLLLLKFSTRLLHKFAKDGRIEVYKFLMDNKWDKEQTDEDGKTSLALSAAHRHLILTTFLIEKGADLNAAKEEIENFRKEDIDFDNFMYVFLKKKDEVQEKWSLIEE